ncbi:MAG: HEAT repeat domain-containing protein, partial [Myxococcota bacterium]|nr:HEAT repeat domain-containing protein [Myxococcota bacterium]
MVEESSESQDTQDERAYVLELFAKATRAEHAISRSEFMRGLSDCSPEIVIEAARETVQGDQFDQHTTALEAITYISKESEHYRDGILLLLEVLKSNDPVITLESLKLLTRLKVEGLSDPFIQLAQHDSRRVRKAVCFAIAGQKTTKAARALIELSQDPTNEVRLWALHHCHHLASHGSPELKALASERLAMEEPGGGSPTAPIVLLARRSDPDVPAELKRLLKNNYLTEDTLKAALELKDPALFEYLWEASWHWQGDPELMASTLEFCRWDDPRETDELIELALTSKNYLAAEQAIALLQRRDTQEVFDSAVLLTEREESEERHLGARLLGRLGGPHGQFRQRAIPSLIGLLEDRNETIVAEAVRAIGESSSDTVDETIKQLENHPHGEVRRLVSVVLYGIENKGSSQALVALSTAREGIVRLAASQALVRILSPRNERPVGRAPARGEDQYADYVGSADHDEEAASSRAKRPRREPGRTRPPSRAAAQPQSKQVNKGLKGLSQQKQKLTAIIGVVSSLLSLAAFAMISSVMQSQGVDDYKDKAPDPEDGPIYDASADDLIDT